ncbi:hypothetical protein BpHYR1_040696 [Brachionus plicatilis]|uniref:Uncharacterized protein n=1 Tax=Brachionus plicatilis TaxID=10195 RepID=A0A3M7P8H1_BRAPC|nr:hypothetical protein BpHYR1_040696 [Brachionus plicatilis]
MLSLIFLVKKDRRMHADPIDIIIMRFNLGIKPMLVLSKIINPTAPMVNKKLEAKPSIMY